MHFCILSHLEMALCDEPVHKKVKTEHVAVYPVDFIKSHREINDTKHEIQPNNATKDNIEVLCWSCGKNIETTSNIILHDIFDGGNPAYQINGALCNAEKSHIVALRVAEKWWSVDEMLSSKESSRYI
jgi:hypothetical protein